MNYVLLFFIYSFLGWCMEVCVTLYTNKKMINRGFLIGPYCPIYGVGAVLITFCLDKYTSDIWVLFVMTCVLCGILEYLTSYVLEKLFRARWWDYSQRKFNLNGRVCLGNLIPFGILGILVLRVFNPWIFENVFQLNKMILFSLTIILCTVFVIDNIITFGIMATIKKEFNGVKKDYTERIRRKVNDIIRHKSKLHERVIKAFPNYQMIERQIKKIRRK